MFPILTTACVVSVTIFLLETKTNSSYIKYSQNALKEKKDKNERQSNRSSMVNEINFWIETQIYEQYLSIKKGFSGVYKNGNKI